MKLKELSFTDLIAIFSAISIIVTAITQAFFYFRLGALWLMPLINSSIYLIEVIKVFIFLFFTIVSVVFMEILYSKITKKYRLRQKIKLNEVTDKDLNKLLIKNRDLYNNNFIKFYLVVLLIVVLVFKLFNFTSTPFYFGVIVGAILGCVLIVVLEKDVSRKFKFGILSLSLVFTSILNAEFKYNQLNSLETVYLTDEKSEFNKAKLVEISSDKAILFKRDK